MIFIPPPGFTIRLFRHLHNTANISVFYARRTGFLFSSQCAVMHFILFYYILTRSITKSNAFLKFYRKNQCVSLFETKTKVFSQTTFQVMPTSCRVQVLTYSSSLLPEKTDFQPTFLGILPKLSLENLCTSIR